MPRWIALISVGLCALTSSCAQEDACVDYSFPYLRSAPSKGFLNYLETVSRNPTSGAFSSVAVTANAGMMLGAPSNCRQPEPGEGPWTVDVWLSPTSQAEACGRSLRDPDCGANARDPRGTASFDWPKGGRRGVTIPLE